MADVPGYDPTLSDPISWIRFQIGDTVEDKGPRPIDGARNYPDDTIQAVLIERGHKNAAVASLFETLSQEWLRFSASSREGAVSVDAKETSENYHNMSLYWQKKPGGALEQSVSSGFWPLERVDGWNTAESA